MHAYTSDVTFLLTDCEPRAWIHVYGVNLQTDELPRRWLNCVDLDFIFDHVQKMLHWACRGFKFTNVELKKTNSEKDSEDLGLTRWESICATECGSSALPSPICFF